MNEVAIKHYISQTKTDLILCKPKTYTDIKQKT